ncbi:MAG: response regulator [Acidobacteriota bacterium]
MSGTARHILIVDDEVDLLEALRDAFSDEGYVVTTAVNGRDALEKLPTMARPCVVILDLLMPVMTGNELVAEMRADPRYSDIPLIVSTSDPSRSPPGVPVMRKPVKLNAMFQAVGRLF